MMHNDEVHGHFINGKREMEKEMRRKVKVLQSDSDGEYTNSYFLISINMRIKHHFTVREKTQ